jgi:hypothetical protein
MSRMYLQNDVVALEHRFAARLILISSKLSLASLNPIPHVCLQWPAALPPPRFSQAGEGSGPRDGAGALLPAEQHHVPGGEQHLRRPRPRHGEAEADEPPPPGRHLAAHRRHGRPLRLLLHPRRVSDLSYLAS